jgi:hypothetical protein
MQLPASARSGGPLLHRISPSLRAVVVSLVAGFGRGLGVLGAEGAVIRWFAASACPSMQWA